MSDLRNMWAEGIQELENAHMHCTNNDGNNKEMDGVEVIDLYSVSQSNNDTSEKKAQSKKVRTNRKTMEWTKWKLN